MRHFNEFPRKFPDRLSCGTGFRDLRYRRRREIRRLNSRIFRMIAIGRSFPISTGAAPDLYRLNITVVVTGTHEGRGTSFVADDPPARWTD